MDEHEARYPDQVADHQQDDGIEESSSDRRSEEQEFIGAEHEQDETGYHEMCKQYHNYFSIRRCLEDQ